MKKDFVPSEAHLDFMRACFEQWSLSDRPLTINEIVERGRRSRPSRYYCAYEYACRQLRHIANHPESPRAADPYWLLLRDQVLETQRRERLDWKSALAVTLDEQAPLHFRHTHDYARHLFIHCLRAMRKTMRTSTRPRRPLGSK